MFSQWKSKWERWEMFQVVSFLDVRETSNMVFNIQLGRWKLRKIGGNA